MEVVSVLYMPAINEKTSIKRAREFFRDELPKLQQLSARRFSYPGVNLSGMPSKKGYNDYSEQKQVVGVDAVGIIEDVEEILDIMGEAGNILKLKYIKGLGLYALCERLGYSRSYVCELTNKALLEFAIRFNLAIYEE